MGSSRIFVANLPTNTKEKDLKNLFSDYGEVVNVELKTKENPFDGENVKVIAFVSLNVTADDAQYCANDLNGYQWNGSKLSVSIAKESFLERLKREREEAETSLNKSPANVLDDTEINENSSKLLQNASNTRKRFAEDETFEGLEDLAPELFITKKRAANSLLNGKIVIQRNDVDPIHVIESKKQTKTLDSKSQTADQKRKESINKMKNQYKQKKSAIQASLSSMDAQSKKKIKFSDDSGVEDEEQTTAVKDAQSKVNLFDASDDDDAGAEFNLKPEHFSKKGEKLLELQSKQSLDPRFKLDAKFVEDDGDEDETAFSDGPNDDNERDWQMNILEQVVGTKLDTGTSAQRAAKNKKMLRFDPVKPDHQKLLRSNKSEKYSENAQSTKEDDGEPSKIDKTPQTVSKDVFYVVTDTLTQSLKTRGDGFSLLNMFGKDNDLEEREDQLKKASDEKILVNKMDKNLNTANPFHYDSSSEDEDNTKQVESVTKNDKKSKQTESKKSKLYMETFFIRKGDPRLKEGSKFFKFDKVTKEDENFDETRNRMKMLIRTKISKSRKHLHQQGATTRRKGRKTRH